MLLVLIGIGLSYFIVIQKKNKFSVPTYIQTPSSKRVYDYAEEWLKNKRYRVLYGMVDKPAKSYMIDERLFFDDDTTMVKGFVMVKSPHKDAKLDKLKHLQGIKIDSKWYFFLGATTVLPKYFYHYDPYESLTWEELRYLSYDLLSNYSYVEDGLLKSRHESVESFFQVYTKPGQTIEELWIDLYNENEARTVTDEKFEEVMAEINNSVRPESPPLPPEITWWEWLKGKRKPLFERDSWKNRDKQD